MENECVINLTNDFVNEAMYGHYYWPYYSFWCSPYISERRLKNARKKYAPYNQEEEIPLVFVDSTVLDNGKLGVLITNKTVYFKLDKMTGKEWYTQGKQDFREISNLYFQPCMSGSHLIINNEKVGLCSVFGGSISKKHVIFINELLASFIEAIKEQRNQ